jgi:hypothetical protein
MKMKWMVILVATLAAASVYAAQIESGQQVTITGRLGSYTDKGEDGFMLTITTNDVVVKGTSDNDWYDGFATPIPVKNVAIYNANTDPRFKELKKEAAAGKTVTLRGSFQMWARHVKLGRHDVLFFRLGS